MTAKKATPKNRVKKVPEYLTDHDRMIKLFADAGYQITYVEQRVFLNEFVPLQSGNGVVPLRSMVVFAKNDQGLTESFAFDAYLLAYNLAMWEAVGLLADPETCDEWCQANPLPDRLKALYDPAEAPVEVEEEMDA